uniref:Putative conserved secreted protein n=1 Tax=Rhipicephalus microplus TaxID=6941 RepID=A0A6G5A3J2_RHIMP
MLFVIPDKQLHVSVMKILGFIALVLATVSETTGQLWTKGVFQPPEYIHAAANVGVKPFCHYFYWHGWNIWYGTHPDGTPCRLFPWNVGYCLHGTCIAKPAPLPCDGIYRSPGFATSCNYTCTKGSRSVIMPYDDGTPCLHPDSKELQAGPAGICHKGTCRLIYKPTPGEDQEMHPGALLRCPEKEHTGESILPRCYYYCNQNGTWYAGLYSSKPSSSCKMRQPIKGLPHGWCCRGDCINKPYCQP